MKHSHRDWRGEHGVGDTSFRQFEDKGSFMAGKPRCTGIWNATKTRVIPPWK